MLFVGRAPVGRAQSSAEPGSFWPSSALEWAELLDYPLTLAVAVLALALAHHRWRADREPDTVRRFTRRNERSRERPMAGGCAGCNNDICTCRIEGSDGIDVTGVGSVAAPYLIEAEIDPASTADVSVSPAGVLVNEALTSISIDPAAQTITYTDENGTVNVPPCGAPDSAAIFSQVGLAPGDVRNAVGPLTGGSSTDEQEVLLDDLASPSVIWFWTDTSGDDIGDRWVYVTFAAAGGGPRPSRLNGSWLGALVGAGGVILAVTIAARSRE